MVEERIERIVGRPFIRVEHAASLDVVGDVTGKMPGIRALHVRGNNLPGLTILDPDNGFLADRAAPLEFFPPRFGHVPALATDVGLVGLDRAGLEQGAASLE